MRKKTKMKPNEKEKERNNQTSNKYESLNWLNERFSRYSLYRLNNSKSQNAIEQYLACAGAYNFHLIYLMGSFFHSTDTEKKEENR